MPEVIEETNDAEVSPDAKQNLETPEQEHTVTPALQQQEIKNEQTRRWGSQLANLNEKIRNYKQVADQKFDEISPKAETQNSQSTIDPEVLLATLGTLSLDNAESQPDFATNGKQAIQDCYQLRIQTNEEVRALYEQIWANGNTIGSKIMPYINELPKLRGLRRLTVPFARRNLEGQRDALLKQNEQWQSQINIKNETISRADQLISKIQQKLETIISLEIPVDVGNIRKEYDDLLTEILQDGTIIKELQDKFLEQVIDPLVDRKIIGENLPEDSKDILHKAIHSFIDYSEKNLDYSYSTNPFTDELNKAGFMETRYLIEPLVRGNFKSIIIELLVKNADKEMAQLEKAIESRLSDYRQISNFEREFSRNSFVGDALRSRFSQGPSFFSNMPLWLFIQSSKTLDSLCGETIHQLDQENYDTLLEKSLTDEKGDYIKELQYYPMPDAIRNLVLIAAADRRGFRTEHLNRTLSIMSKNPDWKQQLDQAEAVYPSLSKVRPLLESWDYNQPTNHPEIQNLAKDLSISLFNGDQSNPELTKLIKESIPDYELLKIISSKDLITQDVVETINNALTILKNLDKEPKSHYYTDNFRNQIRENIYAILKLGDDESAKLHVENINRFADLSNMIIDSQDSPEALSFLTSYAVVEKTADPTLDSNKIKIFLEAYKTLPDLTDKYEIRKAFCLIFKDEETIELFKKVPEIYKDHTNRLLEVFSLVNESKISIDRAMELPLKAADILTNQSAFNVAANNPDLYLNTDEDCQFYREILNAYLQNYEEVISATIWLRNKSLSHEMALAFPQQVVPYKVPEMRSFILAHSDLLLKDSTDIKFLNTLYGEFGNRSYRLLIDYHECLKANVITTSEKGIFLEFARQFRGISPAIMQSYKEAKLGGYEQVYIAQLQALSERMTGSGEISEEERKNPLYKDLIKHVYSNNSGQYGSYESNESCPDRDSDLAEFNIRPEYEIDLLSQSEIRIREGEVLDKKVSEEVQKPIMDVKEKMRTLGHDKEKIQADLQENTDKVLQEIIQKGGLNIDLKKIATLDEKLFLILADSIYGSRSIDAGIIKNLIISYEFANFEDVDDYVAGTSDRVSRAGNQDYALLCEVGTFYSDRIKEVNRRLIQAAWNNPTIAAIMPEYFKKLAEDTTVTQRQDKINRLRVDTLGETAGFISQISKLLEKRSGRKYSPEQVKDIIKRYESLTGGLAEKSSTSAKQGTKAFYGQLRSQRERSFEAFKMISGEDVDPRQAHLGEINFQQATATEANIHEGRYDPEQFASYTVQRFIDLFEEEQLKIEGELSKFESESGKQREVLHAYITKSKESANARMVGGVCVAGDNPGSYPDNMWGMPNYFQLVLQEPDTLRCQGLVLLHHFTENGKRIITASINPSSTYLYSVDETAFFKGIVGSLEQFASDNGFDMITVSQNRTIRTNRTGGIFETAMNDRILQVGKKFSLSEPKQFSYHPSYQLQEMDVIWERPPSESQ